MSRPPDDDLTRGRTTVPTRAITPFSPRTPGATGTSSGRFTPGAVIAGRYRLVALLGRGGMGEVYRADDLTLDQTVALKFLPDRAARDAPNGADVEGPEDAEHLAQFHGELRIARQVSHKNVCRLYDLGDANGRRFLTMEYVDGEDLGALLRRIGRFPQDRAVAIARQLCAGVAAAHERGVIHRDLKPANVMIDGDGNVRITDFGIATAATAPAGSSAGLVGTPQYMAPEQLAGRLASVKSDIYALGLILFEIFTGKPVHDAKTLNELKVLHDTGTVTTPSSIVKDLDPAVERVILRCLDRDPARRPVSALAVAAALPGADPLAAALAAGETPSPDLLAAAGETEAMPLPVAGGLAAAFALGLAVFAATAPGATVSGLTPLEKPPAVLADRAEQILASVGYPAADEADHDSGFAFASDYLQWIESSSQSPNRWDELGLARPGAIFYWYRASPRELVPLHSGTPVTMTDPPELVTDMRTLALDTRGRLREFRAVPPQVDTDAPGGGAPDWKLLFDAAGLDLAAFTSVASTWTPPHFADARLAWEGAYPERRDIRIRVEAASYRGRPVSFSIIGPWTRPTRMMVAPITSLQRALRSGYFLVWFGALVAAAFLARRHVRSGRADRRAAIRLALWLVVGFMVSWAIGTHHVSTVTTEINQFFGGLGTALYLAGILWVLYLALEPYARRLWPNGLLGWTRLFAGHVRDPRVGRDVLLGCLFGIVNSLIEAARLRVLPLTGRPMPDPTLGQDLSLLRGSEYIVRQLAGWMYGSLETAFLVALLFCGLRLVLRRDWLAGPAVILVLAALGDGGQAILGGFGVNTLFFVLLYGSLLFALVRFGLLAVVVGLFVDSALTGVPFPAHYSGWSAAPAVWTMILVSGVAAFGVYTARAGQPLFSHLGQR
jgi:hypothetical protein